MFPDIQYCGPTDKVCMNPVGGKNILKLQRLKCLTVIGRLTEIQVPFSQCNISHDARTRRETGF